jgi:hypothetical protein
MEWYWTPSAVSNFQQFNEHGNAVFGLWLSKREKHFPAVNKDCLETSWKEAKTGNDRTRNVETQKTKRWETKF